MCIFKGNKMKILVLDDSKERLEIFKKKLSQHSLDCCETSKEAIKLLEANHYDSCCLDHDLGGTQNQTSGENTGYEVAEWLSNNPEKQPAQIIIHSYNPAGAQNMKKLLPKAEVIPGVWHKI
jgi:CheY-like chemotaxis protein